MLAGDPSAAEKEFRAGYETSVAMGENAFAATAAAMLSEALYAQKRFDEADEFTATSERLGADRSEWAPTRAKILARKGELEEAVQMARDAVLEASETDDLRLRGDTFMALAEVLFVAGMRDDAKIFVE
jgi:tetratricopeptide (TPR) repeat protein